MVVPEGAAPDHKSDEGQRNMSDYQTEDRNDEQAYKITKKSDIRFNMLTFRYKKRNEFEGSPNQPIPPANQIQAHLEDGGAGPAAWLPGLRSPTQLVLFLVSGLLHFAMGLFMAGTFLWPRLGNFAAMSGRPDSPPPG